MKYSKGIGCLIEIVLFLLVIAFGSMLKDTSILPLWIQIPLLILIGYIYKVKDWITPHNRSEARLKKARKSRNKHKAIDLYIEVLNSDYLSKEDEILVLEEVAKLYSEIGEFKKSHDYYCKGIKHLEKGLEESFLSESERLEALGRIGFYYYNIEDYQSAVNYLDRALDIGLYQPYFKPDQAILLRIMKVYLANNQLQNAIHIYRTLLHLKQVKKSKEIDELLGIYER
ncbi:tetratricopeptide repeat protein [Vallitalea okinawensis]|uniref:tetratricopeptide repeat protein n=1 Tax=Vallitalea okinawensis TaxID=2078660 RepID=UPI000CFA8B8A|nr:hypothetical protein [Vallitalea okinawensis]